MGTGSSPGGGGGSGVVMEADSDVRELRKRLGRAWACGCELGRTSVFGPDLVVVRWWEDGGV